MPDAKEVAEWMKQELDSSNYLAQAHAAHHIFSNFGDEFVYTNENGNLAIAKNVLKEFKKIRGEEVTWERDDGAWRK